MKYVIEPLADNTYRVSEVDNERLGAPAERIMLVTSASQPGTHMSISRVIRNLFPVEPPPPVLYLHQYQVDGWTLCGESTPPLEGTSDGQRCPACVVIVESRWVR